MSDSESVSGDNTYHASDHDVSKANDLPTPQKRKVPHGSNPEGAAPKKRKAEKYASQDDIDTENGINNAVAKMNGPLLADLVARQTQRFAPELSMLELEDLRVAEKVFVDTSEWNEIRNLDNLPRFLEHFSQRTRKSLSKAPDVVGSPHTLVIAGAGLRAADLTRALRVYQTKEIKVAKLFAKHIKLKEAIEFAKSTRMSIGVGTPQRVIDLLEHDALSLDKLERIVVDGSHVDQKKRGILDMRDTEVPMARLLGRRELKYRLGRGASGGTRTDPTDGTIAVVVF